MRIRVALSLVIAFASCASPMTPEERGINIDQSILIEGQEDALLLVQDAVESKYEIRFGDAYLDARIYWSSELCDDKPSVVFDGSCKRGLMWSCDEIYVAVSQWTPDTTCGTSMAHEFGHCLHGIMTGTLDAKHSDREFWLTISSAYVEACELGW